MSSIVVDKTKADSYATVIAEMFDDDKLIAFRLVTGGGTVQTVALEDIQKLEKPLTSGELVITNAKYDSAYKTLVGNGNSLVNYPRIDKNFNLVTKNALTLLSKIHDASTNTVVGAVVYDGLGSRYNVTLDKLAKMLIRVDATNFELTVESGGYALYEHSDCIVFDITLKDRVIKKSYNSYKGDIAPELDVDDAYLSPTIGAYSFDDISTYELGLDTQQNMFLAGANIQKLAPYYSCLYEALERRVAPGLDTLAVTEGLLYYSPSFPAQLSKAELSFVLLHEVCHIAMQHGIRKGNRVHKLWNIATDMYINSLLCNDFGLEYDCEKKFDNGAVLKTPSLGVFPETYGIVLDLSKETPETIYDTLVKENPPQQMSSGFGSGSGSGSSSQDGQNSQGQSSQGQQDSGEDSGDGQESKSWSSVGTSDSNGSNSSSSDDSEGSSNTDGDGDSEDKKNKPQDGAGSNGAGRVEEVSVTYKGKTIKGRIMVDISTEDASRKPESIEKNIEASKNALQRMKTKVQMKEQELGTEIDKSYGIGGAGLVARYIEFGLTEGIDWRLLMKNIAVDKPKKTFTLAMPNVDYMNMGITLADMHEIGKPTRAAKFVVAIDVSGSISEDDLNYYMSEINMLIRKFDVEAELVYWSTEVGDAGMFTDLKSLLKVEAKSTGGTDVSCLFKYLMRTEQTATGKTEPLRVKDIRGVFIITDGCFSKNYDFAKDYFASKTVWLIDGNPITFDPCFGRVLKLEKK